MILNIFLLILGFVLLIKGADIFVDGASSTAINFRVSKMLIGLTIVAFGTSAPEFAVSMQALKSGSADMVIGNAIGSCIMNILLILGIAAVINPLKIKKNTIRKELPICLLISTALAVLFLDVKINSDMVDRFTRSDAIVVLLFFLVFLYYLTRLAKEKKEKKEEEIPDHKLWKSLLMVLIGIAGIIIGSDLVVNNASAIALNMGISQRVIALTIVAFGTSLPELVTTIVSSKKGEQDILLGNIIGSNIFNICIVLGIPVVLYGTIAQSSFSSIDLIMLVGSSLLLFVFSVSKKKLSRLEGVLMLLIFIIYYYFVITL